MGDSQGTYGFCPSCECNVRAERVDFGTGVYEYWGARSANSDWRNICPVCMGDVSPLQCEDDGYEEGEIDMSKHPDDLAVDAFAAAMKEKLAQARARGRGGWEQCASEVLSRMLRQHVEKGDPLDVANFCMFLWHLHQPISPHPITPPFAAEEIDAVFRRKLDLLIQNMTVSDKNEITWMAISCRGVVQSLYPRKGS